MDSDNRAKTAAPDLLVVGAGPTGAAAARRAADEFGWSVLVIDRRRHLAGNCYDEMHESGVWAHRYGHHLFRTNSDELLAFLSRFTRWIPGNYRVKSCIGGKMHTLPINLATLEEFYGRAFTPESAEVFLRDVRVPCAVPRNSEEFVLSRVGRDLYEAFYLGYTLKQWGRHPRDLAPDVCGRVPIRMNRDDRYVDHRHQVMPERGFTPMFEKMLDHPAIEVRLGVEYDDVRDSVRPKRGTVYSGRLDEYFGCGLGTLPWRSLDFVYETHDREWFQPCQAVNYPREFEYTRTLEPKHLTGQKCGRTLVVKEYPRTGGEPYYPVPAPEAEALADRYRELAAAEERERGVMFAGRLAEYRYLDMDNAFLGGLAAMKKLETPPA